MSLKLNRAKMIAAFVTNDYFIPGPQSITLEHRFSWVGISFTLKCSMGRSCERKGHLQNFFV